MKVFKVFGMFFCFFVMFTLGGCIKYDNPETQQEEMFQKFKNIYDNQDFFGESYTISYLETRNNNGITSESLIETSYKKDSNEGYSRIVENDSEINEFIVKKDNNYLSYYSSLSTKGEYKDVFIVGENYYKNYLEKGELQKYIEIEEPSDNDDFSKYSVEVSEDLLEIFVDEEGDLEVEKYEIVENEGIYSLNLAFKSNENIKEIGRYEGREIVIKGKVCFIYDSFGIKEYKITFEEVEYNDTSKQTIKNSLKYVVEYSSVYNSLDNFFCESDFYNITPGEKVSLTYTLVNGNEIYTENIVGKKGTNIKERFESITNYYTQDSNEVIKYWYYDSAYASKVLDGDVFNANNINLYAKIEGKEYLINKSVIGSGTVEVKSNAKANEIVYVTAIPSNGYILDEIFYKKDGDSQEHTIDGMFTMPEGNITIYATFVESGEEYWVFTDYTAGGRIDIFSGKYTSGTIINVNPTPRDFYVLKESYYVKEGTTDKVPFTNSFTMPSYNIEIYVVFEEMPKFDIIESDCNNGRYVVVGLLERYAGEEIEIRTYSDFDYELDYTYYVKEGEVEKHYFTDTFIMPECNITVYAVFKLLPVLYEIDLADVEGGYLTASGYSYAGNVITVSSHANRNFALIETYYLIEGSNEKHFFENSFVMPEGNITIYAVYNMLYEINVYESYGVEFEVSKEKAFVGEIIEVVVRENVDSIRITEVYYLDEYYEKVIIGESFEMPSYNILICVTTKALHDIQVDSNIENGRVEVISKAIEGEIVEVKIIPDEDYQLDELYYIEWGYSSDKFGLQQTSSFDTFTFVMLDSKVGIYASFSQKIDSTQEFITVFSDSSNWSGNYVLTSNIDLNNVSFEPIGNGDIPFSGKFNGNGYIIENVNNIKFDLNDNLYGLFGYVEFSTIKNVGIKNYNYSVNNYDSLLVIGVLIAEASNSKIDNCYTDTGSITVKDDNFRWPDNSSEYKDIVAGGLIGYGADTIIKNSYSKNADIYVMNPYGDMYVGGLVGDIIDGAIYYSYSTVDMVVRAPRFSKRYIYVGGIAGELRGSVDNTYSAGSILVKDYVGGYDYLDETIYAGGIVGYLYGSVNNSYKCENQTINPTKEDITNIYIDDSGEILSREDIVDLIKQSWDNDIWNITNNLVPTLKIFNK